MVLKGYLAASAFLALASLPYLTPLAQVQLSRGMCNFDPCVKAPVAARCEVDVSYVGVALCICPDGYNGDGKPPLNGGSGCQNENECLTGSHDCDLQTQTCQDKNPAIDGMQFQCQCKRGFTPSKSGKACIDIDECRLPGLNLCEPKSTTCRNLPGGYECICKDLLSRFDSNTASCQRINPCEDFKGRDNPCDSETTFCHDRGGTAQCVCRPGYQSNPNDPNSCIDIDECALELDQCDKTIARCQNEIGDYACICKEELGWATSPINRKTCENLDECDRWPMICGDAAPCCADLHPEMGGFTCSEVQMSPGAGVSSHSSSLSQSDIPDPNMPLPDSYSSKALEALIKQAVAQQAIAQQANAPLVKPAARLFGAMRRSTLEVPSENDSGLEERSDENTLRRLQLLSKLVQGVHAPSLQPTVDGIRKGESSMCPIGYRHRDEIARAKARAKTAEALKATFAGSNKASPDQVARGIVTNAGVIANEFANWYNSLANLPAQVAYASQNATNINPAGDAMNAMKSGEQMVAPFIPGGARAGPAGFGAIGYPGAGALGALGGGGAGGGFGVPALAAAGVGGAVVSGAVVGAAVKGGPGDSYLMDRSGISREVAYDRF